MQAKDALPVVMLRGSDSQGLSSSSVPELLTLRFITVELCSSSFGWHLMPLTYHPQAVTGGKASSPLLTDEREAVQKKTFTKWVNSHLARVSCRITDLYTDLRDGRMLIKLLEVLSGERLGTWWWFADAEKRSSAGLDGSKALVARFLPPWVREGERRGLGRREDGPWGCLVWVGRTRKNEKNIIGGYLGKRVILRW